MAMRFVTIRWPRSFRARLLLVYVAGMALSASLVGIVVVVLAEPFNRYMLESGAVDKAQHVAARVQFDATGVPTGFDHTVIEHWAFSSLQEEVVARILDSQGLVHFTSDGRKQPLAPDGAQFDPLKRRSSWFAMVWSCTLQPCLPGMAIPPGTCNLPSATGWFCRCKKASADLRCFRALWQPA